MNKAELVKFSQDHTQQIDIVNTCVLWNNPLLLLNTPYSELNFKKNLHRHIKLHNHLIVR